MTTHRKHRRDEEHQHQVALFDWARMAAQTIPVLDLLYAIPNGGARSAVVGARLKAEGVKAGMQDVCLPVPRSHWASLYVELKTKDGKVSKEQLDKMAALERAGNLVAVCRGWLEARKTILEYLEAKQ